MSDSPSIVQLPLFPPNLLGPKSSGKQADLHTRGLHPKRLPDFVTACSPAMRILDLFSPLHWDALPERDLRRNWGQPTVSNASLVAAYLLKLDLHLTSFEHLCEYLTDHPAFIWLFGFPCRLHHANRLVSNPPPAFPRCGTSPGRSANFPTARPSSCSPTRSPHRRRSGHARRGLG